MGKESELPPPEQISPGGTAWSYENAFLDNRGLITPEEQQRLRNSRAAIVGMGGVGGIDLVTLAQLGIGRFTIADPDVFEIANTNRQFGARASTMGRRKVDVMAEIVRDINPEADICTFCEPIGPDNAASFLDQADILVDAIDAFEIDVRRLLYRLAAEKGVYALGAGPVGFSTVWIVIDPNGMTFDRYFDFSDEMDAIDKFVAYVVGMAPKAAQRAYMDLAYLDIDNQTGPSSALACQLAGGVVGTEVVKILLQRGSLYPAPYYHQFDPYLGRFVRGRLRGGNRHPLQRLKRWWLARYLRRQATWRPSREKG